MIKHLLWLDFETYYSQDYSLRCMSTPEYILDKRFQVTLLAAFDLRWPAPKIILPEHIPEFLKAYPPAETMCCSHNALFDLAILSWRYGWVPAKLQDTLGMVRALRRFKKNSLGAVAKELFGSDTKGDVLPKVKGMDAQGIKNAGLWPDYCTYAMNDVRLCMQIYLRLLKEFPAEEQQVMDLVLRAAVSPVIHGDVPMLEAHLDALRKRKVQLLRDCGYDKAQLMSTDQFTMALQELGVDVKTKISATGKEVPALARTDPFMMGLTEYCEADEEKNFQVQTLAAARLAHKSTIEETRAEKFFNIAKLPWSEKAGNGRKPVSGLLPVPLRYGGAHTHRLSGEWGLNMQNLPRDKLKSRLRAALVAPPGYKLVTADLSQIEARLVAVLCHEDDLTRQFANGDDVYANFASRVFGYKVNKVEHPHERFIGKTAVLGLGYGCGKERFFQMVKALARLYEIPLGELFDKDVADATVDTYRRVFPRIPSNWYLLDQHLDKIINNRKPQTADWGPVQFQPQRIQLPNEMYLQYQAGDRSLYGAKIMENIVQALARIIIMQTAVRLAGIGYRFVLQAHDELVFVVRDDDVFQAEKIIWTEMVKPPAWLPAVPLAAEIGVGQNYSEAK